MDPTKEWHQILWKFGRSATGTLTMIRQVFWEKTSAVHGKRKLTETEKGEAGE
jgi:hypothetical protein